MESLENNKLCPEEQLMIDHKALQNIEKNAKEKSKGTKTSAPLKYLLLNIFLLSIAGFIISYTVFEPGFEEQYIFTTNEATRNSSEWNSTWNNEPFTYLFSVYLYNYTNHINFLDGSNHSLSVVEIGPYVYAEKVQRVAIERNANNTIKYREYRTYEFMPELSVGRADATVIVPNLPMLTSTDQVARRSFFERLYINSKVKSHSVPFRVLTVNSSIWGYDEPLIDAFRRFRSMPFEKFGILVSRLGLSEELFNVYSGVTDASKLNVLDNFNGLPNMDHWGSDECNRVGGTDGRQYPLYLLDTKHPLQYFNHGFCRIFPFIFDSQVIASDGTPALRYKMPLNSFLNPEQNPDNSCYFDDNKDNWLPSGILDVSKCVDAPIFISLPHFFNSDASLFNRIDGIARNVDASQHETYTDVHAITGLQIGGKSRYQINVRVTRENFEDLQNFDEGQLLPVLWMDVATGDIPNEVRVITEQMRHVNNTIIRTESNDIFKSETMQLSLRFGSLSIGFVACILFVMLLVCRNRK